jgi:hypothetical protein
VLDPYQPVIEALAQRGIEASFHSPGQLVISRQVGPIWPDSGNSFYITHVDGSWHLCTWVPICYRVPPSADIVSLCSDCMDVGSSAMPRVPDEIAARYGLQPL